MKWKRRLSEVPYRHQGIATLNGSVLGQREKETIASGLKRRTRSFHFVTSQNHYENRIVSDHIPTHTLDPDRLFLSRPLEDLF